ncbi:DNA cytosine methyltransferase [Georgenia faecalis]|uniref:DNA cytosine methyltransferase n=1 Tax=Georgenia faecalis TaxID=2483799 RepID=UPI000FD8A513|nr:DNA (cytosine-5-)-methyltransferase [Georgenia faecalis]
MNELPPRPTTVELFAGGGGMALGLSKAGFEHLALIEWWRPAAEVLRHNAKRDNALWTPAAVHQRDIRTAGDILAGLQPHLIAGGPPCQPFSLAGVHAGDNDERNMFPAALDIVRAHRPPLVLFENVPGLTRPGFAPYLDYVKTQLRRPSVEPRDPDELWFDHNTRILASHEPEEYRVYQHQIDAADLGVPQTRRRIFLIGIRIDQPGADTWAGIPSTHSRDALLHAQYVTGEYWDRHRLLRRQPSDRYTAHVERVRKLGAGDKKPWVTLRDLLAHVPAPSIWETAGWPNHVFIPGARTYAKHTGSPIDLPSKTIKAGVHGVSGGEAMIRYLNGSVRYLTIREAALAQGFPLDYEFPGYRSRVMGVIGNAVAVGVAAALGQALLEHTYPAHAGVTARAHTAVSVSA